MESHNPQHGSSTTDVRSSSVHRDDLSSGWNIPQWGKGLFLSTSDTLSDVPSFPETDDGFQDHPTRATSLDPDEGMGDDCGTSYTSLDEEACQSEMRNGCEYPSTSITRDVPDGAIPSHSKKHQVSSRIYYEVLQKVMGDTLYACPDSVHRVREVFTDGGYWAEDFADMHPGTAVTAVDFSPSLPDSVPPNCEFIVDNFYEEGPLQRPSSFVFLKLLGVYWEAGLERLLRNALRNLVSRGKMRILDFELEFRSADASTERASGLMRWNEDMTHAIEAAGLFSMDPTKIKNTMQKIGFANVEVDCKEVPFGCWPLDEEARGIGYLSMKAFVLRAPGAAMGLLTPRGFYTPDEVHELGTRCEQDLQNEGIRAYRQLVMVTGQKPV